VYTFLGFVVFIGENVAKFHSSQLHLMVARILFYFFLEYVPSFIPFWFVGMFCACLFPEIKITPNGIKYRVLFFNPLLIPWNEVEDLRQLKGNTMALFFVTKGSFLIRGQYFNRLFSVLLRDDNLVIFLAPGLVNRDKILKEIIEKSSAKTIKKPGDL